MQGQASTVISASGKTMAGQAARVASGRTVGRAIGNLRRNALHGRGNFCCRFRFPMAFRRWGQVASALEHRAHRWRRGAAFCTLTRLMRRGSASITSNSMPLGVVISSPARGHPASDRREISADRIDILRRVVEFEIGAQNFAHLLEPRARLDHDVAAGGGAGSRRRSRHARPRCRRRSSRRGPRW